MSNFNLVFATKLANLLDNRFEILGIKFGLDPILDLIPGVGDVVATVLGCYIIFIAYGLKLPKYTVNKMIVNVIIDFVIGLIPVLGAVGTVFYRSNQMNIKLIEDYLKNTNIEEGEIIG